MAPEGSPPAIPDGDGGLNPFCCKSMVGPVEWGKITSSSGDCGELPGFVEDTFAKPVGQIAAPAFQPEPLKQRSRNEIITTAHGSRRKKLLAHQRKPEFPLRRPSLWVCSTNGTRRQGFVTLALSRALDVSVPFVRIIPATGGSGGNSAEQY
jgi:hypothetical protein